MGIALIPGFRVVKRRVLSACDDRRLKGPCTSHESRILKTIGTLFALFIEGGTELTDIIISLFSEDGMGSLP